MSGGLPMAVWGDDHWRVLGDVERAMVGEPPAVKEEVGSIRQALGRVTRLKDGALVEGHGDTQCLIDLTNAGLLRHEGERMVLTEDGWVLAHAHRRHQATAQRGQEFDWYPILKAARASRWAAARLQLLATSCEMLAEVARATVPSSRTQAPAMLDAIKHRMEQEERDAASAAHR